MFQLVHTVHILWVFDIFEICDISLGLHYARIYCFDVRATLSQWLLCGEGSVQFGSVVALWCLHLEPGGQLHRENSAVGAAVPGLCQGLKVCLMTCMCTLDKTMGFYWFEFRRKLQL